MERVAISVFGLGYVGSVTAACLASQGYRVIAVDVNPAKVEAINAGRSPIVEAQMEDLVARGREQGLLAATQDAAEAIRKSEISFIAVGTPSQPNGKLDLAHVEQVCREVGQGLALEGSRHTVVLRSTVLPGTTRSVVVPTLESASGGQAGRDFRVCYNPEFMREGTAVADFFSPPVTVLGADDPSHLDELRDLYRELPGRLFETSIPVAEMVKYASNAFHAVKVTFANEIGTLAKWLGVDTQAVTEIFTSDTRLNISSAYLAPGFAFGGSCLPKDLRALTYRARELDLDLPLLKAVLPSNDEHLERAVKLVLGAGKKKVAMLGLSFKAGTDDLRESPQVQLVERLLDEGCEVGIWDQQVSLGRILGSNRHFIEEVIPHIGSLLSTDLESVLEEAEVVVISTKSVPGAELTRYLRPDHVVVDLVNLDQAKRLNAGGCYDGICW
jgi:GDP-mannose 6-dehydrogenase